MGEIVQVTVANVTVEHIEVRFGELNQTGFIRWRDLTWDRRVSVPHAPPKVNDILQARLLPKRSRSAKIYLSVRAVHNPWETVAERYKVNQVITGEVVNIHAGGVFVQIEEGVVGAIWMKDIPLHKGQPIADVLSPGDIVQGIITALNAQQQRMWISVNKRLSNVARQSNSDRLYQKQIFLSERLDQSKSKQAHPSQLAIHLELSKLESILVLDDEASEKGHLYRNVADRFDSTVVFLESGVEAQEDLLTHQYDLIIVDLRLGVESGVDFVQMASFIEPTQAFLVTSAFAPDNSEMEVLGKLEIDFVTKDEAILTRHLAAALNNEDLIRGRNIVPATDRFIRDLGMEILADRATPQLLSELLQSLGDTTNLSFAVLLNVNRLNRSVSIVEMHPTIPAEMYQFALPNLYFSPVREVVENQQIFYAAYLDSAGEPRFKNFFPQLEYKAVMGVPLNTSGWQTTHALFVLDAQNGMLKPEVQAQVKACALQLTIALERNQMLRFMRRYEQRFTQGQLLSGLVHEISNKLDTFRFGLFDLSNQLSAENWRGHDEDIVTLREISAELQKAEQGFQRLLTSYSRLASRVLELTDINATIETVLVQFEKKAQEVQIKLHFEANSQLPSAYVVAGAFEQVLTNIILNAIQQSANFYQTISNLNRERSTNHIVIPTGTILIETNFVPQSMYPIQILITDSGPGIRFYRQKSIFLLDTSERTGGHGLGLFISRNLIESMGGRLRLCNSILFLGSQFMIELPWEKSV